MLKVSSKQAIDRVYGDSKNFMTPTVVDTGWLIEGKVAYEVSCGRFLDRRMYGISLARKTSQGWEKWTDKTKTHTADSKELAKYGIRYKLKRLKWELVRGDDDV